MIDYKTLRNAIATWKSSYRRPTGSFQAIQMEPSRELDIETEGSKPSESWDTEDVPVRRSSPSEEPTKEIPSEWSYEDD